MLSPDDRRILSDILTPPPAMELDLAVATTYTLDPTTLLGVPVHLAWLGDGEENVLADPVRLLEALRRIGERITVFADRGHMQAPSIALPLYGLLESMIVEARAPAGGAFHPKLWALRFRSPGKDDEPPHLRIVLLSRNLTADRSWDLTLALEGRTGPRNRSSNESLAALIRSLPDLAATPIAEVRAVAVRALADEMHRAEWDLPGAWEEVRFHSLGLEARKRKRSGLALPLPDATQVVVVSPFVSDSALQAIAASAKTPVALVSRPEEFPCLSPETRARFDRCLVLRDEAESEDGEDTAHEHLLGLHAKAFLFRRGRYTHLFVGSANATDAALATGANAEIVAELVGKASKVGGVEQLLASDGLGELLRDFDPSLAPPPPSPEQREAEQRLERARVELSRAKLLLTCASEGPDWRITFVCEHPIELSQVCVDVRLLSVPQAHAVRVSGLGREPTDLGLFATADVTRLLAFHLETGGLHTQFALTVPMDGLPAGRDDAILRRVIRNREGFLRYLRFLLGDLVDASAVAAGVSDAGAFDWSAAPGADLAVLEDLVRAYTRAPERLLQVRRVVERLHGRSENGEQIVPEEFLAVWDVFAQAMASR